MYALPTSKILHFFYISNSVKEKVYGNSLVIMFISSQCYVLQLLFVVQVVTKNLKTFYINSNLTYFCSEDIVFLKSIENLRKDPSNFSVVFMDEEFSSLENYNKVLQVIINEKSIQIVQLPIKNV